MATVSIISLGCPKNLLDSEHILGAALGAGHQIVCSDEAADVLIINTCGFLQSAVEESEEELMQALELKERGKYKKIILAGCVPQRYRHDGLQVDDGVDAVLGIDAAGCIVDTIERVMRGETVHNIALLPESWVENPKRVLSTPAWTSYIKIAEGCSNRCSYCMIPDIRGEFRSRPEEMIVEEAKRLAELGVKEINLIAQDLTRYGEDFGRKDALAQLLEKLNEIDGLHWIRLMYCYPTRVTDRLIEAIATLDKVAKYIDLPLQHADDTILAKMNRQGSASEYLQLIKKLRAAVPEIALRTTFIVGFPGETDQQFENLLQFVKDVQFDRMGAFLYSPEDGTPAQKLPCDLSAEVKKDRIDKLHLLQQQIAADKNRQFVGKKLEVLVERAAGRSLMGRTYRDAPDIDGVVKLSGHRGKTGKIVRVKIKDADCYDLFA